MLYGKRRVQMEKIVQAEAEAIKQAAQDAAMKAWSGRGNISLTINVRLDKPEGDFSDGN